MTDPLVAAIQGSLDALSARIEQGGHVIRTVPVEEFAKSVRARLPAIETEVATELRSALENYGDHHEWCPPVSRIAGACACGYLGYVHPAAGSPR